MNSVIKFLLATPPLSHALGAAGFGALMLGALKLAGLSHPELIAFAAITGVYWGREEGQLEHDLKNQGIDPIQAWLGGVFMFRWTMANWQQWLCPTAAIGAISAASFLLS